MEKGSCSSSSKPNSNLSNGLSSMLMMNTSGSGPETSGKVLFPTLSGNNYNSEKVPGLMPPDSNCDFIHMTNNTAMKAKIMAHPYFPRLLAAYVNCQKVKN